MSGCRAHFHFSGPALEAWGGWVVQLEDDKPVDFVVDQHLDGVVERGVRVDVNQVLDVIEHL